MKRMHRTTRVFAFLAIIFILAGCSSPTVVAPPTQDVPAIRTESAQTVVARITIEAALNPTATTAVQQEPLVITATPEPTETPAPPTATLPPLPPTATVRPTIVMSGGSSGVARPTVTRRAGPDQAQLVSQEPTDGTKFNAGEEFDGKWTFKNIGTSTWTTGFEYRFARGTNIAKADRYSFHSEVKPGESITIVADMVAPKSSGRYVSYWELINTNGDVFYQFYMVIDVR